MLTWRIGPFAKWWGAGGASGQLKADSAGLCSSPRAAGSSCEASDCLITVKEAGFFQLAFKTGLRFWVAPRRAVVTLRLFRHSPVRQVWDHHCREPPLCWALGRSAHAELQFAATRRSHKGLHLQGFHVFGGEQKVVFFPWKSTGSGRVKQSCSTGGVDGEHGTRFKAVQRICQLRFGQHFQIFLISSFGARKRGDSLKFPRPLGKQVFCTVAQSRMHGSHFHILFHDWRVLQDSEEVGRRAVLVLQFTLFDV